MVEESSFVAPGFAAGACCRWETCVPVHLHHHVCACNTPFILAGVPPRSAHMQRACAGSLVTESVCELLQQCSLGLYLSQGIHTVVSFL
jgi:hypothetical protein